MLTAEEIMTPDVVTVRPEATIHEATTLLLDKGISGLPVVDDSGSLVGILTEYALLAMAYDKSVTCQKVAEHMTREVISVDAREPVSHVADQFIVQRVRRLPVIKNGKLAGLVSRIDVLRALFPAEAHASSV